MRTPARYLSRVRAMARTVCTGFNWGVRLASAEWILTCVGRPNGGDVVFLRSCVTTAIAYATALAAINWSDPDRTSELSLLELRVQVNATLPWVGAAFAATYTALYARFASQWAYLAGVYHQIKAVEVEIALQQNSAGPKISIASMDEWKAGFLEDAENLHLALKPDFASVVKAWGAEEGVRSAYAAYTPGGAARLDALWNRTLVVCDRADKRHAPPHSGRPLA